MRRNGEESPAVGRLIADLESEFDLLRLERYMADLEHRDERLVEEIDALRAHFDPPSSTHEFSPETPLIRRLWHALRTEGRILWLEARRGMLTEEFRRCSAIADDIRFAMHVTDARPLRE